MKSNKEKTKDDPVVKNAAADENMTGPDTDAESSLQDDGESGSNEPKAVEEGNMPEPSMEQKYNELYDRYQRSLAEFDNFRKRTNKEKATMYDEGIRDAVEKLLPIIDNFYRALNSVENKEDKFYQGIEMIARQIDAYTEDLGVEEIEANKGDEFNHNMHFAVAHIKDDEYGESVIIEELQKGYKHKDKVLRPSMVRVAN